MMNSFQKIGHSTEGDLSEFSIVSGKTCIKFDFKKYPLLEKEFNGEMRNIITFNKEQDLDLPPDKNYVKRLNNRFPGTIISMEFYIDRNYINDNNLELVRSYGNNG